LRKVKRSPDYGDRFRLLLGADTLITVGDQVLGKPIGPDSAARMLGLLSGRSHTVVTGVCLAGVGQNAEEYFEQCGHAESRVKIGGLSPAQVRAYIHSGEWSGKAGGYAIQGLAGTFASCVSGELDNVIGLPLRIIHEIIRDRYGHIELF
jgi:septum formation protein